MLDEHIRFEPCDNTLAKSGGRSLASFIMLLQIMLYIIMLLQNHDIFIHLFNTCISTISLYGCEPCIYNKFNKCVQIQYRLSSHVCFFLELLFSTEIHLKQTLFISRSRRSFLAQSRLGILPLKLETGRY